MSDVAQRFEVLDIGCGEVTRGDVNIDIYVPRVRPPNFILASAEHLPFRSGAFGIVRSSYVIEHCTDCTRSIMEHVRCCQEKAVVATGK
ncbi:MAG: methyltransferase domain-containing protein [Chloroflexi bacterium]|nr:methyltransferase domain-containing protein [Chloroflexota bacterium]